MLCESSRSLAEHNITLNHRRVNQVSDLLRADYAAGFDRGNRRNVFSFEVTRAVDDKGIEFADAEAALLYALDHPQNLPSGGTLEIFLQGRLTTAKRWLDNALIEATDLTEPMGVALKWRYTFNGGELLKDEP